MKVTLLIGIAAIGMDFHPISIEQRMDAVEERLAKLEQTIEPSQASSVARPEPAWVPTIDGPNESIARVTDLGSGRILVCRGPGDCQLYQYVDPDEPSAAMPSLPTRDDCPTCPTLSTVRVSTVPTEEMPVMRRVTVRCFRCRSCR